ncbi:MAG: geranylgeranylglyceryl/heptaprenylglyceryl phosphate synthase [Candidatus Nitrosoabyssus spongiisocia]|nr:MAG: geranylgeranylglyceryl/heptaprenylglyceryl phosphate synthase [Nitrosopumilaceae archaeon AB1(1)]
MPGSTEQYLNEEIKKKKTLVFVLIDSEVSNSTESTSLAKQVQEIGASAILVGGSSAIDQFEMLKVVENIKSSVSIPVILFPGNVSGIVPGADAILFMSLLNSDNPYFISQAQALGSYNVLKYGIEALPTAYIIIGNDTTAWFVGSAKGIPHNKPKIAAAYSLSAKFLGMRFVYLEAGSGASQNVTPEMVQTVRKVFDGFIIVGGGIGDAKIATSLANAGADALVLGTILEKNNNLETLRDIINSIQK